jgi:nucleoside-diphosphate-sugar epimerase
MQKLGIDPLHFDIQAPLFPGNPPATAVDVYFMLTPGTLAPALSCGGGYDRLLQAMSTWPIRRALLVSSTAVYGRGGAAVVSAETPVDPDDKRGCRIVDIETRWLAGGEQFFVCRLAGLYGPERIIGEAQLRSGDALPGSPERWLNLIHVDDAARLLVACNLSPGARNVELGSDGYPVQRARYYDFLARTLGLATPVEFDYDDSQRTASRRCDPSSTMTRVGWRPRYAGYPDGLRASLAPGGYR